MSLPAVAVAWRGLQRKWYLGAVGARPPLFQAVHLQAHPRSVSDRARGWGRARPVISELVQSGPAPPGPFTCPLPGNPTRGWAASRCKKQKPLQNRHHLDEHLPILVLDTAVPRRGTCPHSTVPWESRALVASGSPQTSQSRPHACSQADGLRSTVLTVQWGGGRH